MANGYYEIRDVVYGFVRLDQQEWDIVNHEVFQRLRRVKQLSLTDMVYPGATHTRLEHSIGVMQMASDIFDSIIRKDQARSLLFEHYKLNSDGINRYRKIIRLAALLHDIGHAPFSHAGEGLMPIKDQESKERYDHEEYSIAIIKHYFRGLIEDHPLCANYPIQVEEVTALLGDSVKCSFLGIILLFKGIISGQLDADRADYLLRDSIHAGVSYGLYDKDRLVNCIDIGQIQETGDLVLAVQDGGWNIAESLVIARYQMFSQVYFHKTRRVYDHHISNAVKTILENCYPGFNGCYPLPTDLEHYILFDDWSINGKLKDGLGGVHGEIVLKRQHYRKVYETDLIPTQQQCEELDRKVEELKSQGISEYFVDEAKTKWYKMDKDILISDEKTGFVRVLSGLSPIVKSMVDNPRKKRLYVKKH